jgi:hypothetical protein
LQIGAKVNLGSILLTVKRLGAIPNSTALFLTLAVKDHPELIKRIQFFGSDGEEIAAEIGNRMPALHPPMASRSHIGSRKTQPK